MSAVVINVPPSHDMASYRPTAPGDFDRVWRWRTNLPHRQGWPCRVLARGALNSALIEFLDGERHVVSRFAFRKAPA